MHKVLLFGLMIVSPLCVVAEVPPAPLSFHELGSVASDALDQQVVQIRGFLYTADDGQQILAAEPNLKSCCVASEAKIGQQIVVLGELPSHQRQAVFVQGRLIVERSMTPNGAAKTRFRLENASIVPAEEHAGGKLALGLTLLALIGVGGYLLRYRGNFR